MLRVISANLNGIRAAARKGFFNWIETQNADIICVQETKAHMHSLEEPLLHPDGYQSYFSSAEKKGYSGVGIYTRKHPTSISHHLGWDHADKEGRYVQLDFEHISIASLYLPSGASKEERQAVKFDFMDRYFPILEKIRQTPQSFIICGDWNIVHKAIDIKNFKGNQKSSGCLPEERAWLDKILTQTGFVDAFRVLNQEPAQYTWWSHFGNARANNVGWRIDYQIVTPDLKDKIKAVSIYKDENFSDHAPVIVDYDLDFL